LAASIYYTAAGIVALASSAFPMFNAALFIILLTVWRPKSTFNMATAN
jgi:hypothetical protein